MFYPYYCHRFNIIICLNGKIASSRIKEWLIRINQIVNQPHSDYLLSQEQLNRITWDLPLIHTITAREPYKINKDQFKKLQTNGCKTLLVVRNPWHRLLSFYYYWVINQQSNQEGLTINNSFRQVVETLSKRPCRDAHTIPQFNNLDDLSFDILIDMDQLAQQLHNFLSRETTMLNEIPESYQPLNFFQQKSNFVVYTNHSLTDILSLTGQHPADLTGKQLLQYGLKPLPSVIYDDQLTQLVRQIYEIDFKFLNYTNP